jgi:AI-2 transport protein TqsA
MEAQVDSQNRILTVSTAVIASGVVITGLYFTQAALIPFVIAAFIHFSIAPMVGRFQRRLRLPRWVAVAAAGLMAVGMLFLLGLVIVAAAGQVGANFPTYQQRLVELASWATERLPLEAMDLTAEQVTATVESLPSLAVQQLMPGTLGVAASLVSNGVLVLLFLLFMLAGRAVGLGERSELLDEMEIQINRYLLTKVALSALTGIVTWAVLAVLGVEFALAFGVAAFLLNFVPNVGSVIASLLPVPIVLLGDYTLTTTVLAIGLPAAAQFTLGNLIEPKVMGQSLGMHPVVVILTLVLFGLLWGIPGLFLATPLSATLKIVLSKREFTRPIARLMEGDLSVLTLKPPKLPST